MRIWKREPSPEVLARVQKDTLDDHLGIRFTEVGDDYLRATLEVGPRTRQPFGLLHGGASAALAESLGSAAANFCLAEGEGVAVGLELNANHVRAARTGSVVTGTVRPLHVGRTTSVWDIRIEDEAGALVCVARLTMAVRRTPAGA